MVKRRQRSDKSAIEFTETDISVPSDEDVFGQFGSSDLENQAVQTFEFAGISAREAAIMRYQEARESGASADELSELEAKIAELEAVNQGAIVPIEAGQYQLGRFVLSSIGMQVPQDINEDEWLALIQRMRGLDSGVAWAIGALTNHAESTWGQTYEQLAEITSYKYQTLADYAWLDRSVPFSIRIEKLSPSHHRVVAGMDKLEHKADWLQAAAENDWSVAEFKRQISQANKGESQQVEEDSWLFTKSRIPSLRTTHLQKLWSKARNGDNKARKDLMGELLEVRKWLDEVESSVDD